jgi:hypothetical protein
VVVNVRHACGTTVTRPGSRLRGLVSWWRGCGAAPLEIPIRRAAI